MSFQPSKQTALSTEATQARDVGRAYRCHPVPLTWQVAVLR